MDSRKRLENKRVVILGASRGIGKAIAELFADHGANVFLMSRNEEQLKKVTEKIKEKGGLASYITVDISDAKSVERAFQTYAMRQDEIDVLVNNAGVYRENSETNSLGPDGAVALNLDVVQDLINVNMLGYWWSTVFAEPLLSRGASIINISSVNGIQGKGACDIYDMTKTSVNILTKNKARQLASRKIRVNAICPSSTVTPMRDDALGRYLPSQIKREEFDVQEAQTVPFKRLGLPKDIAYAALHFASDESQYTTGQIHSVDGGYLLMPTFPGL